MAVTQTILARNIKDAIDFPLKDLVEKQGTVGAGAFLDIAIEEFVNNQSKAIATAIAKAVREGVVG